jgi:hypothetical protein
MVPALPACVLLAACVGELPTHAKQARSAAAMVI